MQQLSAGRIYTATPTTRYSLLTIRSRKGGAGRPGSRPVASDLDRVGRKERPARSSPSAARRLDRPATNQAGARRLDFAAFQAPGRRLDGLSTNQPTHWTTAPRLPIEARCRPPPSSSPRRDAGEHTAGRMSLSAYVNNQYGLTISARRGPGADEQKVLLRMSETPPRTAPYQAVISGRHDSLTVPRGLNVRRS